MDEKIKILLDKINVDEASYQYFSDAKITKVKVNSKIDSWLIFIDKDNLPPVEVYEELQNKKNALDENTKSIDFVFNIKNIDNELYLQYYQYLLKSLKEDLHVLEIYEDCMKIENDFLTLVTSNEAEKARIESCLEKINTFYKKIGYKFNIDVIIRHEDNILEEIQQELNNIEMPSQEPKKKETTTEQTPSE